MNLKHLILLSTVLLQVVYVKSDCDDYLTCLSDFFSGFFVDVHNGTFVENNNDTRVNSTDLIEDGERNASVRLFEIEDFGKSLEKVLFDVTSLIREEIEDNLKIISESNVFRTVDNKTDIYVKTYDLDRKDIANITEMNSKPNIDISDKINKNGFKNVLNIAPISLTTYSEIYDSTKEPTTSNDNHSVPKIATKTTNTENNINLNTSNKIAEIDNSLPTTSTTVSTATKTTDNFEIKTYFFIPEDVIQIKENVELINTVPVFTTDLTTALPISTIASNDFTTELSNSAQSTEIIKKLVEEKYLEKQDDNIDLTTIKPSESSDRNSHPKLSNAVIYNITKVQEFNDIINVRENEILNESFELDYEMDDNATDYPIIDYIDLYKDTTNENVVYIPTEIPTNVISGVNNDLNNVIEYTNESLLRNGGDNTDDITARNDNETAAMVPWIATIFIKNGSSNQFEYTCDGAILSERVILTAAHCVADATSDPENFIIILGKRSLIASTQYERVHKVKQIKRHGNFSSDSGENDLAVLILEEATVYSDVIQPACLYSDKSDDSIGDAVTTGWAIDGNLTFIHFLKEKSENCVSKSVGNTFCATYGNKVATCPSYGGLYANKQTDKMCLKGIRAGNPANRGFCIDRNVYYTSLKNYFDWINDILSINKD